MLTEEFYEHIAASKDALEIKSADHLIQKVKTDRRTQGKACGGGDRFSQPSTFGNAAFAGASARSSTNAAAGGGDGGEYEEAGGASRWHLSTVAPTSLFRHLWDAVALAGLVYDLSP
jgi:hypothetical protein